MSANKFLTVIASLIIGITTGIIACNYTHEKEEVKHGCITMEDRDGDYHWNDKVGK
jgi:hypothetical protein